MPLEAGGALAANFYSLLLKITSSSLYFLVL
jgi:hypothetical protein